MSGSMRCDAHGLALGPDGHCVLCRRDSRRRPRSAQEKIVLLLGSLVGLLLIGGAGWALRTRPAPPAESAPLAAAPAPEPLADSDAEGTDLGGPEPAPEAPAREPPPAPLAATEATDAALDAAAPEPRPAPTQAEVTRALRSTPVTMFTTAWCGVCARARSFFRANQIAFRERDIDKSPADRRELLALTGTASVPYIDIDGQHLSGFGEASATEALRRSVERRLGVSGLTVRSTR